MCRFADIKIKLTIANELRDSLDIYSRDIDPAKFFEFLLPCFMEILSVGKPTLSSGTLENVSDRLFVFWSNRSEY